MYTWIAEFMLTLIGCLFFLCVLLYAYLVVEDGKIEDLFRHRSKHLLVERTPIDIEKDVLKTVTKDSQVFIVDEYVWVKGEIWITEEDFKHLFPETYKKLVTVTNSTFVGMSKNMSWGKS